MRRLLSLLVLLSALLLTGCPTTKSRSDAMTTTLNAYASTLRWGDFQSAAQFIDPAVREAHPLSSIDIGRYKQVKVSDYDDGAGPVPLSPTEVQQTVHVNLVNIHTQTERSVVDHQTWRYDETAKHWWLMTGLPDITQE